MLSVARDHSGLGKFVDLDAIRRGRTVRSALDDVATHRDRTERTPKVDFGYVGKLRDAANGMLRKDSPSSGMVGSAGGDPGDTAQASRGRARGRLPSAWQARAAGRVPAR